MRLSLAISTIWAIATTSLLACSVDVDDELLEGPELGKADSAWVSDSSCRVALQEVDRDHADPTERSWYAWTGTFDVAQTMLDRGAKPSVWYRGWDAWRREDKPRWNKSEAKAETGAPPGFQRFRFRIWKNILEVRSAITMLPRLELEVRPALLLADGGLFDNNRESFVLSVKNNFKLDHPPYKCPLSLPDIHDRDCQIVLRTVARDRNDPYEDGWIVWTGTFDVADRTEFQDGKPFITYSAQTSATQQPMWWRGETEPVRGAWEGYQRHEFAIWAHIIRSGSPWTGLEIKLRPILERADGSRLIDENRVEGDYLLSADNDFALEDDLDLCHEALF